MCSVFLFLALVFKRALQERLESKGYSFEWADILLDLDNLTEVELDHSPKRFVLRSQPREPAAASFGLWESLFPQRAHNVTEELP